MAKTDPRSNSPSPTSTPRQHSRNTSNHAPMNPSRLRQSVPASSSPNDEIYDEPEELEEEETKPTHRAQTASFDNEVEHPVPGEHSPVAENEGVEAQAKLVEPSRQEVNARTRLLENYNKGRECGPNCDHGTFSPHAPSYLSRNSSYDSRYGVGGRYPGGTDENGEASDTMHAVLGDSIADGVMGGGGGGKMSTTKWLAKKHGIKNSRSMYLSYYFPAYNWMKQYRWKWFQGDLVAALTMASFYIPMSLSYASNLGHIPPINGLYSFVFNPIIYALLGTCPQMVVGPEAAGSLLLGTVVRTSVDRGSSGEDDATLNSEIAGVVTTMAGAIIFGAGLTRLGFLDSVLSRPFLRGFISAIGFVIMVDQLIPELGLGPIQKQTPGAEHGSSVNKIGFLFQNIGKSHGLTTAVSIGSFAIIMVLREVKRRLQPRFPSVAYFPDRFLVVLLSAVFAWKFGWDEKGVEVLGNVKSANGDAFQFHWPLQTHHVKHIDTALSTSFIIALLGFFESSVAAKSLGEGTHELQNVSLSANRELVALGVANLVGGCFMALPAFGGYGRSKVNSSTGGTTPMSSILLSLITVICVLFVVPYFYYLPKGVLSAMISVVAWSLIEECPHDIKFFVKIRGWKELFLMAVIFLATIFYSLTLGIALGIGLSLLILIKHATKARIQILGKVPGTTDKFENAEQNPDHLEFVEGCLICKIPEPLTFANTAELKNRLRRLEYYGTNAAHPALPRVRREEHNKNVIFDVHGVTSIDGSGTQVLTEIVEGYVKRGVRVIFCRLPRSRSQVYRNFRSSGIVDIVGGESHFVPSVDEALKLTELEDMEDEYYHRRND